MIKNYFKIALRNIRRYSTYSILNITGMAIGMACSILLLLWVQYQFSYDRFYKNADRLYRVLERHYADGKLQQTALTSYPLAPALKEAYPEIIRASRYDNFWKTFISGDNLVTGTIATVDRDFFEMFDIKFVEGDKTNSLNSPYDIIITEDMANRYFGKEDPIGKKMTLDLNKVFTVTGVIKNVPRNSHLYIDCIVSTEYLKFEIGGNLNDWKNASNYTYIELMKGTDSREVEGKFKDIMQRNLKDSTESKHELFIQNFKNIHLHSHGKYAYDMEAFSITPVRIAALIAILILTIVCINFMNLLTAQSSGRAKEIGVRKISGATKRKIVFQFLGEAMLVIFVAHIIAMILVELSLPVFNTSVSVNLKVNYQSAGLYIVVLTVILFCGIVAGCYPALYLSSLQPINILKGIFNKDKGNAKFRRILVTTQFTLSFLFIISTLIIKSQLSYMTSKSYGADFKNVAYFEFYGVPQGTIKNEISGISGISDVSISDHQYILNNWTTVKDLSWKGKKDGDAVEFTALEADRDYIKTFHLELKEGNYLSADEFSNNNSDVVINEKAAAILGFQNPIGEVITSKDGLKLTIIGVVKNFHFKSFHFAVDPLIISPIHTPDRSNIFNTGGICYVRMSPDSIATNVNKIRAIFKAHNLEYPVKMGFLEDEYNSINIMEMITGTMFGLFAFLTIIISVLGLIGLSTFMTLRRTKEIGIRKAHGAKSSEIFAMLSKEYFILVGISFIIASPIAWFAINIWLQSFVYRVHIGLMIFALAWVIVMVITMLTVGLQSYRAANKNPVEALRYE
jgi:putative ABC transport system permease protein